MGQRYNELAKQSAAQAEQLKNSENTKDAFASCMTSLHNLRACSASETSKIHAIASIADRVAASKALLHTIQGLCPHPALNLAL
jgi:hypothetical protein